MKKTFLIRLMTLCFFGLILISCSNDGTDPITIPQTSLKIIAKDSNGKPVPSAVVRVFMTYDNAINQVNQVLTTKTTNELGEVTFSPVTPIDYFFRVDKGCQNNLTSISGIKDLAVNSVNSVSTVVSANGKLTFSNTSSNPYDVYVNNVLIISNMAGKTTDSGILPTGNYTIKVVQKSGYAITPTIKYFTADLVCGGDLTATFP